MGKFCSSILGFSLQTEKGKRCRTALQVLYLTKKAIINERTPFVKDKGAAFFAVSGGRVQLDLP